MNPSFGASESIEEPTTGGLRAWERVMRRGVDAARGNQPLLADSLYLQALGLAQPLLMPAAPSAPRRSLSRHPSHPVRPAPRCRAHRGRGCAPAWRTAG